MQQIGYLYLEVETQLSTLTRGVLRLAVDVRYAASLPRFCLYFTTTGPGGGAVRSLSAPDRGSAGPTDTIQCVTNRYVLLPSGGGFTTPGQFESHAGADPVDLVRTGVLRGGCARTDDRAIEEIPEAKAGLLVRQGRWQPYLRRPTGPGSDEKTRLARRRSARTLTPCGRT